MARPDQPAPDIINDRAIRIEEGLCEVIQIGIIQGELALEGAIRDTAQALQHRAGLRQDLLECHNRPSACLGVFGLSPPIRLILPEDLMGLHT